MNEKHICISFLGNIAYDTRTLNFYKSLKTQSYKVDIICFDWQGGEGGIADENIKLFKLDKKKSSLLFYFKFALLLLINLFKSKASVFFAEDIYTLPFVCFAAKLKGAKVFYDSRELFGFLAGLKDKKLIQKILAGLEKHFIKKVDYVIVTGEMDGEFLRKQYNISKIIVIRNLPFYKKQIEAVNLYDKYGIEENKKILLYQGVVLHGRGIRTIFNVLKKSSDFVLLIVGDGEYKDYYEKLSKELYITHKVIFTGKISQDELLTYSAGADIGLALIENVSISYYYALPNKLFEYIMAGLPVAVSKLPQMEKIVNDYKVGISVNLENEDEILNKLVNMSENKSVYAELKSNCHKAAEELNWDKEIEKLFIVLH